MDDIFYLTEKNVTITDIAETAKESDVINVFVPLSENVLQIEYEKNVYAEWSCMKIEDFSETEDKIFLERNKIKSVFCISYHMNNLNLMLPHIKILLQKYGGFLTEKSP